MCVALICRFFLFCLIWWDDITKDVCSTCALWIEFIHLFLLWFFIVNVMYYLFSVCSDLIVKTVFCTFWTVFIYHHHHGDDQHSIIKFILFIFILSMMFESNLPSSSSCFSMDHCFNIHSFFCMEFCCCLWW